LAGQRADGAMEPRRRRGTSPANRGGRSVSCHPIGRLNALFPTYAVPRKSRAVAWRRSKLTGAFPPATHSIWEIMPDTPPPKNHRFQVINHAVKTTNITFKQLAHCLRLRATPCKPLSQSVPAPPPSLAANVV